MGRVTYFSKKIGDIHISTKDSQVIIETQRLVFKSLNSDTYDTLVPRYTELLTNDENISMLNTGTIWDKDKVQSFLNSKIADWNNGECFGYFSGYDKKTNAFLGSFSARRAMHDYEHVGIGHKNAVEFGGILDHQFWKQHYGYQTSIIIKKYIKHCILELKDHTNVELPQEFVATAHPKNIGSLCILEKILENCEPLAMIKYGNNERYLFFKSINLNNIRRVDSTEENAKVI